MYRSRLARANRLANNKAVALVKQLEQQLCQIQMPKDVIHATVNSKEYVCRYQS